MRNNYLIVPSVLEQGALNKTKDGKLNPPPPPNFYLIFFLHCHFCLIKLSSSIYSLFLSLCTLIILRIPHWSQENNLK